MKIICVVTYLMLRMFICEFKTKDGRVAMYLEGLVIDKVVYPLFLENEPVGRPYIKEIKFKSEGDLKNLELLFKRVK
jgi:hypothetical protein